MAQVTSRTIQTIIGFSAYSSIPTISLARPLDRVRARLAGVSGPLAAEPALDRASAREDRRAWVDSVSVSAQPTSLGF